MLKTIPIIFLILFPLTSHAIIPLKLVAEFELPENTVWDVQHWMDDSTFGWAAIVGDSVYCQVADDENVLAQPVVEYGSEWNPSIPIWTLILRLEQFPQTPSVLVVQRWDDGITAQDVFDIYNMQTGEFLLPRLVIETRWDPWDASSESLIDSVLRWPPPPDFTRALAIERDYRWEGQEMSGQSWAVCENGLADLVDFARWNSGGAEQALVPIPNASRASFYRNYVDITVAALGRHSYIHDYDIAGEPFHEEFSHSFHGVVSLTAQVDLDTICVDTLITCPDYHSCLALRTDDSEHLALKSNQYCLDLESGQALWMNNFTSKPHRIRPYGNSQDYLLVGITGQLAIIDVSNGQIMDSTIEVIGSVVSVLECANSSDQIVTVESGVVRVFGFDFSPTALIQYIPDTDSVALYWSQVFAASSYIVCRSQFADADFCEQDVISVVDTFLTLPLIEGINKEFFRVKAVFE